MKRTIKLLTGLAGILSVAVALLLFSGCTPINETAGDEYGRTNGSDTYAYLDPYGGWVNHPQFGEVWRPDFGSGWAPFSDGDWIYTSEGWLWSSYEPYGWLVYHYGNWYHDPEFGWFWVPGETWSPACVTWMAYGDYVAWAPAPPPGGIWPTPWDNAPTEVWNVVKTKDFTRDNVGLYRVRVQTSAESRPTTILHQPPDIKVFERGQKHQVTPVKVTRVATSLGQKTLYRTVLPAEEQKRVERNKSKVVKSAKPVSTPTSKKKVLPPSTDKKGEKVNDKTDQP